MIAAHRPPRGPLSWAIFDRSPDSSAILLRSGLIVAVNQAWRAFGPSGGTKMAGRIGSSYVGACRRAADAGDDYARQAVEALTVVLDGSAATSAVDYPCVTPNGVFWRRAQAIAVTTEHVLIRHVDITDLIAPPIRDRTDQTAAAVRSFVRK